MGYPYICTPQAHSVRTLLYKNYPIPDGAMFTLPTDPFAENNENGGFIWVQSPDHLAGLLVRWMVPEIGTRYIVLPFFPYPWETYLDQC